MYNNPRLKRGAEKLVYKAERKLGRGKKREQTYDAVKQVDSEEKETKLQINDSDEKPVANGNGNGVAISPVDAEDDEGVDAAVEEYNAELELKEKHVVEEAFKHAEEELEEEKG